MRLHWAQTLEFQHVKGRGQQALVDEMPRHDSAWQQQTAIPNVDGGSTGQRNPRGRRTIRFDCGNALDTETGRHSPVVRGAMTWTTCMLHRMWRNAKSAGATRSSLAAQRSCTTDGRPAKVNRKVRRTTSRRSRCENRQPSERMTAFSTLRSNARQSQQQCRVRISRTRNDDATRQGTEGHG